MNFANFIPAILGALGLASFSKVNGVECLTEEEMAKMKGYGFNESFIQGFNNYLKNPQGNAGTGTDNADRRAAAVSAVLAQVTTQLEATTAERDALRADKEANAATIEANAAKIDELTQRVAALASLPESGAGRPVAQPVEAAGLDVTNDQQLLGMSGVYNAMDRAYNQRARAAMMASRGYQATAPKAQAVDFKSLQEDLGAFYRRPWLERVVSMIELVASVQELFPEESGHQDLDTLVNVYLGEFSQADTSGKSNFRDVEKGAYDFGTETLRMYGVMFVYRFKSLKDLERTWIGYLNREGSNPVKLSFIEFLLTETAKALYNEQQNRLINGVYKESEPGKPGKALDAADGFFEYIRKRVEGHRDLTPNGGVSGKFVYQIKPFTLPQITAGNIGEVFYQGTSMIPAKYRDTGRVVLYVPSWMIPLYNRYNEVHYGQNNDYKAGIDYVKEFPGVKIKAIPNADGHGRIVWTFEGNIKTYTDVAGEMLKFNLEIEDWSVKVYSNWKESIQAEAVGKKYTDPADMDGSQQVIWCNDTDFAPNYFVEADADKNPSVLLHSSVKTVANSSVLTISDIDDAKPGKVVTLMCGADGDQGVEIKATGKFELLASDWKPAKGDVIKLMKRADGKFIELERGNASTDFFYQFADDEATPSLAGATDFVTGANTKETEITDFEDAIPGVVYTIHGNGTTNASTIAKGDKFVIGDPVTLSEGKFIKLVKAADGKFYEIDRG